VSRLRRVHTSELYVFVTTITYQRKSILLKHTDLLDVALRRSVLRGRHDLIAWCIMPEHVHFLLRLNRGTISDFMKSFKLSFLRFYKRRVGRGGRLWQRRFHDHVIRSEMELHRCIDYIHLNPVRRGYVARPGDWADSSFRLYLAKGMYEEKWGWRD